MTSAQSFSAARPPMVTTKFNPYSIAKAAAVSDLMDSGMTMDDACATAGMSSSTYRYALLAGKAVPPKRAKINPVRFSARSVARFLKMEELMTEGMYQSCAATAVGVSNESYSMWRLQDEYNYNDLKLSSLTEAGELVDEVRDFADEQRKASRAMSGLRSKPQQGAKVCHGSASHRATEIKANALGADWSIKSVKRTTDRGLVVKAVLSDLAEETMGAAKATGFAVVEGMEILTALQSIERNCFGKAWSVDKIEGGLSGITVTASLVENVEKTAEQLDEEKLIEMLTFLRRSSNCENLDSLAGVLSDFPGGEAYQRAVRAMKARHH